jgi:NAD(P) transhydrogenase subunit alpha
MNELIGDFTIFVLAIFVGYEVISRVPVLLHTPLMSGTNAIHGIVLVGAILVTASADSTWVRLIGFLGVILGTINVVGGFLVTDRMLQMFAKKPGKGGGKP